MTDREWWGTAGALAFVFWGIYLLVPGSLAHIQVVAGAWLAADGLSVLGMMFLLRQRRESR